MQIVSLQFAWFLENKGWHLMQIVSSTKLSSYTNAWSVKSYFLGKIKKKKFKTSSAETFTQHAFDPLIPPLLYSKTGVYSVIR